MTDTWLEPLSHDQCIGLLCAGTVGRVAVIHNGYPVVVPVNYRLVETTGPPWIAIRTRAGNVLDQRTSPVGFEIDSIDVVDHRGWSVLVRGTLHHINPTPATFAIASTRSHGSTTNATLGSSSNPSPSPAANSTPTNRTGRSTSTHTSRR